MNIRARIATASAFAIIVTAVPILGLAQVAHPCVPGSGGGILTGLAQQFSTQTDTWKGPALAYARGVFVLLVGIEIAWSGITYVLQKDNLPDFVAALVLKLLSVGFFFMVIQFAPIWIADIVASFIQAGSAIGGQTQFGPSDPSSIFNCGLDVANNVLQSVSPGRLNLGWGNLVPGIVAILVAIVAAFGVVLAFAVIAGQLLVTLIESYIVVGGGLFFLGFTGSRWTLVFGERFVGYAFSVGIKLFMLELIVGLGYGLGQGWANMFASGLPPPEKFVEVVGSAVIFAFVAWQIPNTAAALMNGSPRGTLGTLLSTTASMAVATMTAWQVARSTAARVPEAVNKVKSFATAPFGGGRTRPDTTTGPARHVEADVASSVRADTASRSSRDDGSPAPAPDVSGLDVENAGSSANSGAATDRDAEGGSASDVRDTAAKDDAASRPRRAGSPPPQAPNDSAEGSIHIRFRHTD